MKTLFTLAALAAATLAAPAIAEQPQAPETQRVRYADLDLSKPADVQRFDLRINRAARWACGDISTFDLAGQNRADDCRRDMVAKLAPVRDAAIRSNTRVQLADRR